ncbi:hypothetical protein MXMO3_00912 [Maritalea myrionectae]|uniref:Uncharacterized protein n=1 Tax=Maritalea myrionectae TaxID=454601 RepID=A0A2R4MBU0_9HYPH|nr:hypothetical protein [Maritalea myrionectae]AVX03443.1 hypothetical protein MXMO3_00912 [Maritalea myrionectae]
MDKFRFFGKTYKDQSGVTRIKYRDNGRLDSKIYFELKKFSNACEYASSHNFHETLLEASHGLSCVIMYQDYYYAQIVHDDESDYSVAKLFIVCRFSNSIYASMRLACMGLILDSIGCLKTAFEALQYSRLISLKPDEASTFLDPDHSLRPVEVRKKLQQLEHDAEHARDKYSMLSTFSHVGGTGEMLTLEEIDDDVSFRVGGYVDPSLQEKLVKDCHLATGEFIAFNSGIRQENVERFHQTIKDWIAEGATPKDIANQIKNLVNELS